MAADGDEWLPLWVGVLGSEGSQAEPGRVRALLTVIPCFPPLRWRAHSEQPRPWVLFDAFRAASCRHGPLTVAARGGLGHHTDAGSFRMVLLGSQEGTSQLLGLPRSQRSTSACACGWPCPTGSGNLSPKLEPLSPSRANSPAGSR